MIKFITAGGGTSSGTAASIAFLWSNWDSFHQLAKTNFTTRDIGEMAWSANGFGAEAEFRVYDASYDSNFGVFWVLSAIKFLRVLSTADTYFYYFRLPSKKYAYFGVGTGVTELPSLMQVPIRILVNSQTRRIARLGQVVSEQISERPGDLLDTLGRRTYLKFEEYSNALSGERPRRYESDLSRGLQRELIPQSPRFSLQESINQDALFMLNVASKAIDEENFLVAYGALQWLEDTDCDIKAIGSRKRWKWLRNTVRILDEKDVAGLTMSRFQATVESLAGVTSVSHHT